MLILIHLFTDLQKLYNSKAMDPESGPRELQTKVMFDIRYYFCHRGGENIKDMIIGTFELKYDPHTGISYVQKTIDELTKNHREKDTELITGFMPQIKNADGSVAKLCPMRSYENYINSLDKDVDYLWQRPKPKIPKNKCDPWFVKKKVGHNTHEKFMAKLSEKACLSQHYTNHCIRVTGITNLRKANFTSKQIMAVSGHKSVESLAIYEKVHEDEKLMMGLCLTYSLLNPTQNAIQEKKQQVPIENSKALVPVETAIAPYQPPSPSKEQEDTPNFDLMQLINDMIDEVPDDELVLAATQCEKAMIPHYETENKNELTTSNLIANTSVMKRNAPLSTFLNCKIGSIGTLNIHIHKN